MTQLVITPVQGEVWRSRSGATIEIVYVHARSRYCSYVGDDRLFASSFEYLNGNFTPVRNKSREPLLDTIVPPTPATRIPVKDEVWASPNESYNATVITVYEDKVAYINRNPSNTRGELQTRRLSDFLYAFGPPKEVWETPLDATAYMVVNRQGQILPHLTTDNATHGKNIARNTAYPGVVQVKITPIGEVIRA